MTSLVGRVRSWKEPWGFIVSDAFEGDLFAHKDSFVGEFPPGSLSGAEVQFEKSTDPRGRPAALNIQVIAMGKGEESHTISAPLRGSKGWGKGNGGHGSDGYDRWSGGKAGRSSSRSGDSYGKGNYIGGGAPRKGSPQGVNRANSHAVEHLIGQKLRGEIRNWKGDFGFLVSKRFEGDLFVHRQNAKLPLNPAAGTAVSFQVQLDVKGRATATEVTEATSVPEDSIGQGAIMGTIRSWKKDWGFIVAPEYFDGDLFCHQDNLALDLKELGPLDKVLTGKTVAFEIAADRRGRTCANNVMVDLESQNEVADFVSVALDSSPPTDQEVAQGVVRSWREPWGFIVCPEKFEGDLFCHKDAFTHVLPERVDLVGQSVEFVRTCDQKGRFRAEQVQLLGWTTSEAAQTHSYSRKAVATEDSKIIEITDPRLAHLAGATLRGNVVSWKVDSGFIASPENFAGDLYCHKDSLDQGVHFLAEGARVEFQVDNESRGRPSAQTVKCINDAKDWADTDQVLCGQIRSFKHETASGFIVSPGSYSGDLFFDVDSAADHLTISPGAEVLFKVIIDNQGRCKASEVQPNTEGRISKAKREAPYTGITDGAYKRARW